MKRTSLRLGLSCLAAMMITSFHPTSAGAQSSFRAWVSSGGNDSNDCTRAAPCATFQTAHDKAVALGEINCVDSGSYFSVTITKSITIDCGGNYATVGHGGQNAVTVSAGAADRVVLRNLNFNGFSSGLAGVQYNSGAKLEIDNVTFSGNNNPAYPAVNVTKTSAGILFVRNSNFSVGITGIKMQTTSGNIVASVTNTNFNNLTNTAIEAGANSYVSVHNSVFTAVNGYGINAATSTSTVYATDNVITNTNVGISATVAGAKIITNGNRIFGNSKAFNAAAGAVFLSGGGNNLDINPGNPATGTLTWK